MLCFGGPPNEASLNFPSFFRPKVDSKTGLLNELDAAEFAFNLPPPSPGQLPVSPPGWRYIEKCCFCIKTCSNHLIVQPVDSLEVDDVHLKISGCFAIEYGG